MGRLRRGIPALIVTALALLAGAVQAQDFQFKSATPIAQTEDRLLSDIAAVGNKLVAVGERGLVLRSSDDGQTWQQAQVPVSTTLTAVSFPTPELGWAVGHAGIILHSSDGGATWRQQFDGHEANRQWLAHTQQVKADLEAQIAAIEEAGDPDGVLDELTYALEDAEFSIEDAQAAIDTGPADPLLDVLFTSPSEGWAVGAYGMVYRTIDGGQRWTLSVSALDNPDRYHFYAVAGDAAGNLYLSGEAGLLYHSADNGNEWTREQDVYIGSLFGLVSRGTSVYTFGLRGNIFRSDDGGNSWTSVVNPTAFSLYGGTVLPDGAILLVGAGGGTLRLGEEDRLQAGIQPSRATLSGVAQRPGGATIIVGMEGAETYAGPTGEAR